MDLEIRALVEHAALCRDVANGTPHKSAAHRLQSMAEEYESRARDLGLAGVHGRSIGLLPNTSS
jgi:hypothetical protein